MKQIKDIASKKHQSVAFRVLMLWKALQKASIFKGFRTFWATPKPLVVGSSPTAPAKNKTVERLSYFLSIAKAMAYHHALACISSP